MDTRAQQNRTGARTPRQACLCAALAVLLPSPLAGAVPQVPAAFPAAGATERGAGTDTFLWLVQSTEPPDGSPPPKVRTDPGSRPGPLTFLNPRDTGVIVRQLDQAADTCDQPTLRPEYRIDCLRVLFQHLAQQIPATGEYAPVRAALEQAAADLDRLVSANLDPSVPAAQVRLGGKPLAPPLPPMRAVRQDRQAQAARTAVAIVEEAETLLLRSTENSQRRMVHFQPIIQAIDSTKVLLRSA